MDILSLFGFNQTEFTVMSMTLAIRASIYSLQLIEKQSEKLILNHLHVKHYL